MVTTLLSAGKKLSLPAGLCCASYQYKAALHQGLYLQSAALSRPARFHAGTLLEMLFLQGNFNIVYFTVHREPLWKQHGKCRVPSCKYLTLKTAVQVCRSWSSPFFSLILTMFQSLAGTCQAYRHYTVWTRMQTNHNHCLQTAPSALPELTDQFNTSVHPCHTCLGSIYDTATATCQVTDLHLYLNLRNMFQITDWDHGLFLAGNCSEYLGTRLPYIFTVNSHTFP